MRRGRSTPIEGLAALGGMVLLVGVLGTPLRSDPASFGTREDAPEPQLVRTTCSPPELAGPPQFLSHPKGTAKYPFDGICTSPERLGAQINYRLEGSWSPSETDPNKPNASESIEITGFEPFIPVRAPGGRIFMYWTARCKQDPWLRPEGASCRLVGTVIPDDLRQAVPDLLTLNFPKTENMISPVDRQRLSAQYAHLNSPATTKRMSPAMVSPVTADMFVILKPAQNDRVVQGQLVVTAKQPKLGMTPISELEFKWLDAPPNQPYVNVFAVDTPKLLAGYPVPPPVTRGYFGRWEVRARSSGKAVPGPWSLPVQFRLFLTQPTQSQRQTSPVQQTAPLPPSSVMQAPAPSSSAPAQMRRSPSMIMPRGVEEKGGKEGNQTVNEPAGTEKKP